MIAAPLERRDNPQAGKEPSLGVLYKEQIAGWYEIRLRLSKCRCWTNESNNNRKQ